MAKKRTEGSTLILFDLYGCSNYFLHNPERLKKKVSKLILEIEMTIKGDSITLWKKHGATFVNWVLEESHVDIETWTLKIEDGFVNGAVQICNYSRNNEQWAISLAKKISGALKPREEHMMGIQRGPFKPLTFLWTTSIYHQKGAV